VPVLEDNDDVRSTLCTVLELAGHEVHGLADGMAGVEAAQRLRPDVALIDVGLPGIDGYEVARRIRAQELGNRILLVALTGYGQPEDRELSFVAGFDLHETKPVDTGALLEKIERWPALAERT
jgi:two-component system, sensor histidine kinase